MAVIEINWTPSRPALRNFALAWLIGFLVIGLVVAWRSGALSAGVPVGWRAPWAPALAIWGVALVGAGLALVPGIGLWLYRGWMGVAYPVGWLVSHVLLGTLYFGLFSAVGLVFRLTGRDLLGLRFDRSRPTYWVKRPPTPGPERYFRQF